MKYLNVEIPYDKMSVVEQAFANNEPLTDRVVIRKPIKDSDGDCLLIVFENVDAKNICTIYWHDKYDKSIAAPFRDFNFKFGEILILSAPKMANREEITITMTKGDRLTWLASKQSSCPCCGKTPIIESGEARKGYDATIGCDDCNLFITTIYYDTLEEAEEAAISAWNKRFIGHNPPTNNDMFKQMSVEERTKFIRKNVIDKCLFCAYSPKYTHMECSGNCNNGIAEYLGWEANNA